MKTLLIILITFSLNAMSQDFLAKLVDRREKVKQWALQCADGAYSEKIGECKQGDATLFSGVSCLAAVLAQDTETEKARCGDVANAQGENGRWWRGPSRVDDGKINSFSRDMARGVQAYLVAQAYVGKDQIESDIAKDKAILWLNWITSDEGDNKLCTEFTNNRCRITKGSRNLFYSVFQALDILPSKNTKEENRKFVRKIHKSKNYTKFMFWFETTFLTGKGYPRHLKATSLLINRVLNTSFPDVKIKSQKKNKKLNRVARSLHKRDKENLLMEFMYKGLTDNFKEKIFEYCPVNLPNPEILRRDFQWQRNASNARKSTDGHDCIYLLNLAIAKLNNRFVW